MNKGLHYGCPLYPLPGVLYLNPLDDAMAELDVFYARFMDDWVILAKTRWKLGRAIKVTNKILADLKVEKHPYKTYIGAAANGFDFLGYRFKKSFPNGLGLAWMTISNHLKHRFSQFV